MNECKLTGCSRPVKRDGLCASHHARAARGSLECVCQTCGCTWTKPLANKGPRKYCSAECVAVAHAAKAARSRDARRARKGDEAFRAEQAAKVNEWRRQNPEAWKRIARRRHLMGTYNITPEQYDEILARQGGHCAMCPAVVADEAGRQLHVDHDHSCCPGDRSCGRCVRGLLCKRCNTMLGCADDDVARLLAAVQYLAAHHADALPIAS